MSRQRKVAFVTESENPEIRSSKNVRDDLLALSLRRRDVCVQGVPWDDDTVDWKQYDLLIMRSAYNYHLKLDNFLAWMNKIKELGIKMQNTPEIIKWNVDKTYLFNLEAKDNAIPRTVLVDKDVFPVPNLVDLAKRVNRGMPNGVVIKPRFSSAGYLTFHLPHHKLNLFQSKFCDLVSQRGMLVQEYLPEITSSGEWALFYIGKKFSHAVRKLPKPGEFRVQHFFGGSTECVTPSDEMRSACDRVISSVPGDLLYARVDVVEASDNRIVLMELELTEPTLHFDFDPNGNSHEMMANLIIDQM